MSPIAGFIVILGSPNDAQGKLSNMGQGRVARGYAEYRQLGTAPWKILLTGGFGTHFNTTTKPHAYYAQQLLLAWGVPATAIVEFAESGHTVEDALLSGALAARYGVKNLRIVTSDFHLPRVQFIFTNLLPKTDLTFIGAEYLPLCNATEQQRLLAHEAQALAWLRTTYPSWS